MTRPICLLAALCSTALWAAEPAEQLLAILRGVQAREAKIQYLSGTAVEHTYRSLVPADVLQQPVQPQVAALDKEFRDAIGKHGVAVVRFAVADGKYRLEALRPQPTVDTFLGSPMGTAGEALTNPDPRGYRVVAVADGDLRCTYHEHLRLALYEKQTARLPASQSQVASWLLVGAQPGGTARPIEQAMRKVGMPTGRPANWTPPSDVMVAAKDIRVEPAKYIEGHSCVGVTVLGVDTPNRAGVNVTYWLAEELGFALLAVDSGATFKASGYSNQTQLRAKDMQEIQPGIWLPRSTEEIQRTTYTGGATSVRTHTWRFKDLSLQPMDDSVFRYSPPLGALLQSSFKGGPSGYVGGITPALVAQAIEADEDLTEMADETAAKAHGAAK